MGDTEYLEHAIPSIQSFLDVCRPNKQSLIFIPYAGVSIENNEYETLVKEAFQNINIEIESLHHFENKRAAIEKSSGIVVGGGNTFALLKSLYELDLIDLIKNKVELGLPYIGWSAGSNIAGPTIRTTNDMPIVQPPSFAALNLLDWQINPHYIDGNPPGHRGETRQQRIEEFLQLNDSSTVIGLPEGTALLFQNQSLSYIGNKVGYVFKKNSKLAFDCSTQLNQSLTQ